MTALRKIIEKAKLGDILIGMVAALFAFFYFTPYAVFFAALFLCAGGMFALAFFKIKAGTLDKRGFHYSIGIFSFFFVAVITIACRNFSQINIVAAAALIILSVAMLEVGIWLLVMSKTINFRMNKQRLLGLLPVAVVMLLAFILSIDSFFTYHGMDSGQYFAIFGRMNLDSLNRFVTGGHYTYIWDFLVYFLYCLTGNLTFAANLFNVLCLALLVPATYRIVKSLCVGCPEWFAVLCAACLAFSAFTFGFTGYTFAHTALMYGILFIMFATIIKDKVLMFLSSLLVIYSFETGVLVTGVIVFFPILFAVFKALREKTFAAEVKKQALNAFNIAEVFIHLIFVIWFFKGSWAAEEAGNNFSAGFNKTLYKSLVLISNFNWILVIVATAAGIKLIVDISQNKVNFSDFVGKNRPMLIILGAFGPCLLFSSFTATFNYIRYILPLFLCFYFVFFAGLYYLIKSINRQKLKKIVGGATLITITVLSLVQSYFTIDPIMLTNPRKTYTGSGKSCVVNASYPEGIFEGWYLFDGHIYNKQVANYEIALDKALASINYNQNMMILTQDIHGAWINGDIKYSAAISLQGWDNDKKRRYYTDDASQLIRYRHCFSESEVVRRMETESYTEFWFLDFNSGWFEPVDYYVRNYGVKTHGSHVVSYMGWRFTLTKISL